MIDNTILGLIYLLIIFGSIMLLYMIYYLIIFLINNVTYLRRAHADTDTESNLL